MQAFDREAIEAQERYDIRIAIRVSEMAVQIVKNKSAPKDVISLAEEAGGIFVNAVFGDERSLDPKRIPDYAKMVLNSYLEIASEGSSWQQGIGRARSLKKLRILLEEL